MLDFGAMGQTLGPEASCLTCVRVSLLCPQMRRHGLAALTLQEPDQQRLGVNNGNPTPPDISPVSLMGKGQSAMPGISDGVLFWGTTAETHTHTHTDETSHMELQTKSIVNKCINTHNTLCPYSQ